MSDFNQEIQQIRREMLAKLEAAKAPFLPIFIKNWKRYEACARFLLTEVPDIKSRSICDYGCGHPYMLYMLRRLGLNVIGFEPYATEDEWQTARTLGVDNYYSAEPGQIGTYDLVVLVDVIEHISVVKFFMEDMKKLMNPGGQIFISTPNVLRIDMYIQFLFRRTGHPNPIHIFATMDNNYTHHQREFTLDELKFLFKKYQFRTVKGYIRKTVDREAIRKYHNTGSKSLPGRVFEDFKDLLMYLWPNKFANNILFLAQENFIRK